MSTPQGTRRSPYCQRLTLLGPTPNRWATRCCARPSVLQHLAELHSQLRVAPSQMGRTARPREWTSQMACTTRKNSALV